MDGMISTIDTLWVLLGATLIFFMQAGFAMLETGFTRAKNAGNIVMKNFMDFAMGSFAFFMIGFGLMHGSGNGFIGNLDFFIRDAGIYDTNVPGWANVVFQTMFCATSATIVSGAMAGRTKFSAYLIYSFVISAFIYPVSGHWVWGGGWLSTLEVAGYTGFTDFAGSAVVHMTGGIAAFVGAKMLGARIGKYDKNGHSRAIPGHNIALGALGIFILWFGWFGFNGTSTLGLENMEAKVAEIFMTTNISAACAAISTMFVTWIKYKKPDISMTLNGGLAGLVAITAGCAAVEPWAAAIIGSCAGIIVVFAIEFIDKVLKVDDPVGAISVHGVCGTFGALSVGLFATEGGLFTTGHAGRFLVQLTGVLAIAGWIFVTMTIVFKLIDLTVGLRVSKKGELVGLDVSEHGMVNTTYADAFSSTFDSESSLGGAFDEESKKVSVDEAIPVQLVSTGHSLASDVNITKVEILIRQEQFEKLKNAMNEIGVTGMTVSQVLGCGMQKGAMEYYRGISMDMHLLPKVKVEMVIAKVPVELVVNTAKNVLYTGHIGDGKIFIYHVENVVKIRTSEVGYDALQGIED